MNQMSLIVQKDVPVVPILDLEDIAHKRVGRE
jgi:hypothetical protein